MEWVFRGRKLRIPLYPGSRDLYPGDPFQMLAAADYRRSYPDVGIVPSTALMECLCEAVLKLDQAGPQ